MPWTDITRPQYVRHGRRYASDCSNAEWALIEPFMPRFKKTARLRTTELAMSGTRSSTWPPLDASGR